MGSHCGCEVASWATPGRVKVEAVWDKLDDCVTWDEAAWCPARLGHKVLSCVTVPENTQLASDTVMELNSGMCFFSPP